MFQRKYTGSPAVRWVAAVIFMFGWISSIDWVSAQGLEDTSSVRLELKAPEGWSLQSKLRLRLHDGETALGFEDVEIHPGSPPPILDLVFPAEVQAAGLRIESEDFWAPSRSLAFGPSNTLGSSGSAQVELWPKARLSGTIKEKNRQSSLDGQILYLTMTEVQNRPLHNGGAERARSFDLQCPIDKSGQWVCAAPAGRFHLRLSVAGFVPRYLWDRELSSGEEQILKLIALEKGASVAGWLTAPFNEGIDFQQTAVKLRPLIGGTSATLTEEGRSTWSLVDVEGRADTRGFFQISGVGPGSYELLATGPGLSETVLAPIEVVPEAESRLSEPVELAPLSRVEWALNPPFLPDGFPWNLTLIDPRKHRPVREGQTDLGGVWVAEGLSAGEYILVVSDERGSTRSRIHVDRVLLDPGDQLNYLDLPLLQVEGVVSLKGEPVPGTLWLGGQFGKTSIPAEVDEEGGFSAYVSREGLWALDFARAGSSGVQSLEKIELRRPSYGGPIFLEVELPDTRLSGRVIDSGGRPVAAAQILLLDLDSRAKVAEVTSGMDGLFSIESVRPGDFRILATASEGESRLTEVSLEEGRESAPVDLRIEDQQTVSGVIQSAAGPVPGAFLAISPSGGLGTTHRLTTGGDGSFEVPVPSTLGALEIVILAPSHALSAQRVAVPEDGRVLRLNIERSEAQLELDVGDGPLQGVNLVADGVPISSRWLSQWVGLVGDRQRLLPGREGTIVLPRMSPGSYQLCSGLSLDMVSGSSQPSRCEGIYLAPSSVGRLALAAPQPTAGGDMPVTRSE